MNILKNRLVIRGIILLAVAIALGLAFSCTRGREPGLNVIEDPDRPGRFTYKFETMGTDAGMIVNAPDRVAAQRMVEAGVREVKNADAAMSDYRADSEVSLLNREGAKGPVELWREISMTDTSQVPPPKSKTTQRAGRPGPIAGSAPATKPAPQPGETSALKPPDTK